MTPRTRTSRWRLFAVLSIVSVLALGACGEDKDDDASGTGGDGGETSTETIDIGSQAFSESRTLAEVYAQYLEAEGFDVAVATPIDDRTQLYTAMDKGTVDLEIDYLGSAVVELKGEATSDADETYAALETALEAKGWQAAADGEATNANALVALASWAEENEVTTISDLKNLDGPLTLGGTPECAEREDCLAGYNGPIYDLGLEYVQVAYGPAMVTALEANEVELAQYGSTAPELADGTIVELEDDQGLQSAQNIVPVMRSEVVTDELIAALDELTAKITTEDLAAWNLATDGDAKEDPADVAQAWLEEQGLI